MRKMFIEAPSKPIAIGSPEGGELQGTAHACLNLK
jgi:hypothetical protein